jgi:hypothetical protein
VAIIPLVAFSHVEDKIYFALLQICPGLHRRDLWHDLAGGVDKLAKAPAIAGGLAWHRLFLLLLVWGRFSMGEAGAWRTGSRAFTLAPRRQ